MPDLDQMDLNGVEIFAAGTWHAAKGGKVTVTETDLDAMVSSFQSINQIGGYKPVLKLGHSETQRFFGGKDGAPALGFVSRIWRDGQKVLADFAGVPRALFDLIKQGRYHQR